MTMTITIINNHKNQQYQQTKKHNKYNKQQVAVNAYDAVLRCFASHVSVSVVAGCCLNMSIDRNNTVAVVSPCVGLWCCSHGCLLFVVCDVVVVDLTFA